MSKMKKVLSLLLVVTLVAGIAISGTLAYLTSEDSDVNVMTLGNVEIEQFEKERVYDADGKVTGMQDYTQEQLLMPAVVTNGSGNEAWQPNNDVDINYGDYIEGAVGGNGTWQYLNNVMDKFVFVKNTGKSDAYYRTIIAYEAETNVEMKNDYNQGMIHFNINGHGNFEWDDNVIEDVEINGVKYNVFSVLYKEVLKPNEISRPSLLQVGMDQIATNEYVEQFGDTYEILVLSQAVQTAGFSDAKTALDTGFGEVNAENVAKWFSDVRPKVEVEGSDKAAVLAAIEAANPGDKVVLTADTTIAGYAAKEKLIIDKDIILDLNGKTLTTECGWGGIDLKGGASIVNGTINHTGNTAAIKAFQVGKIEDVTINVTETAGKTKGGIVVQEGDGCYVGSIKNVTINDATNGIECYRTTSENAIGSIENVTIKATANGIYLNGAGKIGKISNSDISGGNIGINAYLANLWHISLNIENSMISGGTTGIDIWDEAKVNTGSTVTFNYDDASVFTGSQEKIKITLQKEITCTVNGASQETPCDERITE